MTAAPRFTLRYAVHLGFRSFDRPLFARAARSVAPADQIVFAAEQGFAGVQDPWFSDRDAAGQDAVAAALAATGLPAGTLVVGGRADLARPLWLPESPDEARRLDAALARALADAARIGATDLAVVPAARPDLPIAAQEDRLIAALRDAGDRAAAEGRRLSVEAIGPGSVPGLLLTGAAQAARVVRAVAHPAVRLIFDTGHLLAEGEDPLQVLERDHDILGPVQIAGQPGRCEPGQGDTPLAPVLEALVRQGHGGLVELEHLWREDSAAAERAGLAWLDALEPRFGLIRQGRNGHEP